MSRAKGTANLAASLEVLAGAPLDAREKVPTKADLYLAANFPYPYVGLETYVVAENKKYRLVGNNVTVEANWEEIGSGGGGGTTVVANPEGEATDDLEKLQVGNDIYSIPEENVEINKDQFDALPAATKNNGKAYFIPDANLVSNFTVMGNRFDKANIYDTSERMVGRWIDGKPIWQITKYINSGIAYSGSMNIGLGSLNIENIVSSSAFCKAGNDTFYPLNFPHPSGGSNMYTYFFSGSSRLLNLRKGKDQYAIDAIFLTIQYTKTTDASVAIGTENDYSTDEMIIGTWIDGKPLYQKTCTYNNKKLYGGEDYTTLDIGESFALVISGKLILESSDEYNGTCIIPECRPTQGTTGIRVYKTGTWNASADRTWQFTVQYTKTTD